MVLSKTIACASITMVNDFHYLVYARLHPLFVFPPSKGRIRSITFLMAKNC
jgi:hypothetical protein